MARYVAAPTPGYDPLLRISLRAAPEGGAALPTPSLEWRSAPIAQRELLVLIHGYNNHLGEAEAAYAGMRARQAALLSDSAWQPLLDDLFGDVFWPGDARWAGALDKLDFFFYAQAVGVARDVAPKIGAYLRQRSDVLVVHFLAHSLGCRVALEVIADLLANGGPAFGRACLMAAAVPTFKMLPGGTLFAALTAPDYLRILYSPADWVLGVTFPPGQMLAGFGEGAWPSAVGHQGDIPLSPGRVDREHVPGARHGDYWGQARNQPSWLCAESVSEFFRFDRLAPRPLKERPLPPRRPPPERRGVADFVGG